MDFYLNDALPIWKQLAAQLKERIVTGEYPAGSRFPSVRELAQEAGVNPNTMQRAMAQLEAEGLVVTNRTLGRTVTADPEITGRIRRELAQERMTRFLRDMEALGYSSMEVSGYVKEGKIG